MRQDIIHIFHVDKFQFFSYGLRYFFHISFILFREQDLPDPELAGGKNFLFHSADGKDFACEGNFAVAMVIPAEGPSFGTAPSGRWIWVSSVS